jgi:hypothetical protein
MSWIYEGMIYPKSTEMPSWVTQETKQNLERSVGKPFSIYKLVYLVRTLDA